MTKDSLILLSEFVVRAGVNSSFVLALEERGLVNTVLVEQEVYIHITELPRLEKISRLYTDLEINVEGIEAITHLLERIENLQGEITSLGNRLKFYE
jgi:chaperone modulatory protein CbpM